MSIDHHGLGRRAMLGMSVAGAATLVATAAGAETGSSTEGANQKLVADFCARWAQGAVDVDRLVATYFHPACIIRMMDSALTANGHVGTSAMLKSWLEGGRRFDLKVLKSQALGPLVIQTREDFTYSQVATPHVDRIAAVFVIADGKIKEWSDYFM